ncbi:type II toxin-antitoxin system PemK/MazF family toxin [bacterium 1XD8-76]|nr:type II toxin-antitoxin system PemK/MazF family toxin [bacterium 1XD8-76]
MSRTGKRKIKRGDVLLVDLGAPEHGSEQAGRRPVVVVSNDWVNCHNHVYTVVPLTTQINRLELPTNVLIPANKEEGVTRDAVALCAQTRSLDAVRILRKAGRLNKDTLERVTKGVLIQIGIEPMTLLS